MLVFIDESGDPGFKTVGSSPVFVVAMVMFANAEDAALAQGRIKALAALLKVKPEFKFSKCKDEFRTAFFEDVAACRFRVRAVVVRKERVHSPNLREVKESFYKFFIRMIMKHDGKTLVNAKVVIDGSGDREFKKQFRAYLRKHFDTASVRAVDLKDSCDDELIQLADMAVGAIARAYKPDQPNGGRWLEKLRASGHIDNIWEFR
jgi:Protein of unknown function (DUF3800)